MCKSTGKPDASDSALSTHEALLALYDVLARYNAAIRVKYPPSAPLARVMERNTSGWANDAPSQIQEFKHAAEDAIYAELAEDYSLGDGVNEILDAAQEWAGHTPIANEGREVWRKTKSRHRAWLARACSSTRERFLWLGLAPEADRVQRE